MFRLGCFCCSFFSSSQTLSSVLSIMLLSLWAFYFHYCVFPFHFPLIFLITLYFFLSFSAPQPCLRVYIFFHLFQVCLCLLNHFYHDCCKNLSENPNVTVISVFAFTDDLFQSILIFLILGVMTYFWLKHRHSYMLWDSRSYLNLLL